METIKVQMKEKEVKTDSTQKKTTKKVKGKKKSKKLKQEKHYKNLKELLDDIEEEKNSKSSKEKKEEKIQKEEIKIEEIPIKDCLSIYNLSISGTTVGSLSLDGNENYTRRNTVELKLKPNYILKNCYEKNEEELSEDNIYKKRKISSSILDYYKDFDNNLLNKEDNENIDINKSVNFVKKSKLIEESKKIEIKEKKEINNNNNLNNNNPELDNKFNIEFYNSNNNMNYPMYNYMDYYNYNNIYEQPAKSNDIQNIINNITQKYYSFPYNKKIRNEKGKNKYERKYFDNNENKSENKSKRGKGEWICKFCFNLNYSFRKLCNRCNALKQT